MIAEEISLKCVRVIMSCKTMEQLDVANKYASLTFNLLNETTPDIMFQKFTDNITDALIMKWVMLNPNPLEGVEYV